MDESQTSLRRSAKPDSLQQTCTHQFCPAAWGSSACSSGLHPRFAPPPHVTRLASNVAASSRINADASGSFVLKPLAIEPTTAMLSELCCNTRGKAWLRRWCRWWLVHPRRAQRRKLDPEFLTVAADATTRQTRLQAWVRWSKIRAGLGGLISCQANHV